MSENTQTNAIYAPNELSRILPSHEVAAQPEQEMEYGTCVDAEK